jgi:Protein of unknown function (DUF3800)
LAAKALGGALSGDGNVVKLVYIDEAGISNTIHEPYLVVAAIVVNPDKQWRDLERYYDDLANELFADFEQHPDVDPYRFVFHAKDVWHGNGAFDRRKWKLQERMKVMSRLAQVPSLFNLRVGLGIIDRERFREEMLRQTPAASPRYIQAMCHTIAFVYAIQDVDAELEKNAPDEVAMLIAEDAPQTKKHISMLHEGYTASHVGYEDAPKDAFLSKRIVDTVHFAKKDQSLLLQIADHCAFIAKRKAMKCPHVVPFYHQIKPQFLAYKKNRGSFLVPAFD